MCPIAPIPDVPEPPRLPRSAGLGRLAENSLGVHEAAPAVEFQVGGNIRLSGVLDQNTAAGQLVVRQGHVGRAGGVSIQGGDAWNRGALMEFWGESQAAVPGYAEIVHGGAIGPNSKIRFRYYDGVMKNQMTINNVGQVVVGDVAPLAQLHVDQERNAAAIPVLYLDQADISEEMIEFACTVGVGNAIEAVGGKTLTTTHFIKVTLPGALTRYIPVGTIA